VAEGLLPFEGLVIAHLVCFPLIPAALAVVWSAGAQAEVTRFWTAVLAAGYACYITLPWLVSSESESE
jgi:uncharacterized membrane protein (DUF4010 family)